MRAKNIWFGLLLIFLFTSSKVMAAEDTCQQQKSEIEKSHSISPNYTIQGTTVKTLGFSFRLKNATNRLNDKDESFDVLLYKSPDKKKAVLSLGSGESRDPYRDLWLIDFKNKKIESLDETGGSFASVVWYSNDLFEIAWGGNGYEESVFIKLGKIRQKAHIDDFYDLDPKREVYVAFGEENKTGAYLEVGSLFNKDATIEKFPLPPEDFNDPYMAHLPRVEIKGNKVFACLDKGEVEGKLDKLVFYPKILK